MSRHPDFVPQGVIPAVLLPFHDDLSIDEASFRAHLRDVAAVQGLSAITDQRALDRSRLVHARTNSAASWRSRRGSRRQIADHSRRLGRRQSRGGADRAAGRRPAAHRRCWCSRRRPFTMGQSAEMALAHFKTHRRCERSADHRVPISARDRPGLSGGDAGAAVRRSADHPRDQGLDADGAAAREPDPRAAGARASRSTCCPPTARGS